MLKTTVVECPIKNCCSFVRRDVVGEHFKVRHEEVPQYPVARKEKVSIVLSTKYLGKNPKCMALVMCKDTTSVLKIPVFLMVDKIVPEGTKCPDFHYWAAGSGGLCIKMSISESLHVKPQYRKIQDLYPLSMEQTGLMASSADYGITIPYSMAYKFKQPAVHITFCANPFCTDYEFLDDLLHEIQQPDDEPYSSFDDTISLEIPEPQSAAVDAAKPLLGSDTANEVAPVETEMAQVNPDENQDVECLAAPLDHAKLTEECDKSTNSTLPTEPNTAAEHLGDNHRRFETRAELLQSCSKPGSSNAKKSGKGDRVIGTHLPVGPRRAHTLKTPKASDIQKKKKRKTISAGAQKDSTPELHDTSNLASSVTQSASEVPGHADMPVEEDQRAKLGKSGNCEVSVFYRSKLIEKYRMDANSTLFTKSNMPAGASGDIRPETRSKLVGIWTQQMHAPASSNQSTLGFIGQVFKSFQKCFSVERGHTLSVIWNDLHVRFSRQPLQETMKKTSSARKGASKITEPTERCEEHARSTIAPSNLPEFEAAPLGRGKLTEEGDKGTNSPLPTEPNMPAEDLGDNRRRFETRVQLLQGCSEPGSSNAKKTGKGVRMIKRYFKVGQERAHTLETKSAGAHATTPELQDTSNQESSVTQSASKVTEPTERCEEHARSTIAPNNLPEFEAAPLGRGKLTEEGDKGTNSPLPTEPNMPAEDLGDNRRRFEKLVQLLQSCSEPGSSNAENSGKGVRMIKRYFKVGQERAHILETKSVGAHATTPALQDTGNQESSVTQSASEVMGHADMPVEEDQSANAGNLGERAATPLYRTKLIEDYRMDANPTEPNMPVGDSGDNLPELVIKVHYLGVCSELEQAPSSSPAKTPDIVEQQVELLQKDFPVARQHAHSEETNSVELQFPEPELQGATFEDCYVSIAAPEVTLPTEILEAQAESAISSNESNEISKLLRENDNVNDVWWIDELAQPDSDLLGWQPTAKKARPNMDEEVDVLCSCDNECGFLCENFSDHAYTFDNSFDELFFNI